MLIEEIILPKAFVTDWTSIDLPDFFFLVIFLASYSPSTTASTYLHSFAMNSSLGKSSRTYWHPSFYSNLITFSEGLSSSSICFFSPVEKICKQILHVFKHQSNNQKMIGTNKNELQDWIETTTFLISKFMFILNTDWMVIFFKH